MTTSPDLKTIAKHLASRERFSRDNPLFFVRLNRPQQKFMNATSNVRPDRIPRRLVFVGGNKTGKTSIGVIRGISLALGEHPFLPPDHPLRRLNSWPVPNTGLVVGEQLTQAVDKKLVPEYLRWIPKICEPETRKNQAGVVVRIILHKDLRGRDLGSVVHFRSFDMKEDTFEGLDQNWIHWDEPPPYRLFVAAERGLLPSDGISFMTFTSLKEPWIKDYADQSVDYGGSDEATRVVEGGSIYENSTENGGFLSPDAIKEFVKIVPQEEYAARILGQWLRSGSLIYSSFKDDRPYVIPPFDIPPFWSRIEAVDPHDAYPTLWLFAAISPQEIIIDGERLNRIYVVDYLSLSHYLTIKEMVAKVLLKRAQWEYTDKSLYSVILDSKYGRIARVQMDKQTPTTWQDRLEEAGAGYVELSYSKPGAIELGHKMVKAYLIPQRYNPEEKDVPGLVFFDTCRGIDGPIESMKKYRYKEGFDEPEEQFKGWCDTARYIALARPTHVDRVRRRQTFQPRDPYTGR